jgi:hypothetical protein
MDALPELRDISLLKVFLGPTRARSPDRRIAGSPDRRIAGSPDAG